MKAGAVRLLGVPPELCRSISEHHDEVARELKLVVDPQQSSGGTPIRLIELAPLLDPSFKALVGPLREAVTAARQRGDSVIDVEMSLTADEVRTLRDRHGLLCQADEASREGELLALPLSEEAVALRAWIVDEAARQVLDGADPRPWPEARPRA